MPEARQRGLQHRGGKGNLFTTCHTRWPPFLVLTKVKYPPLSFQSEISSLIDLIGVEKTQLHKLFLLAIFRDHNSIYKR